MPSSHQLGRGLRGGALLRACDASLSGGCCAAQSHERDAMAADVTVPAVSPETQALRRDLGWCSRKPWPTEQSSSRASASWRLGLDPHRDGGQAGLARERDHGRDHRALVASCSKPRISERSSLSDVERQVAGQAERGLAGAEVVERDRDAEALDVARAPRVRARGRAGPRPR